MRIRRKLLLSGAVSSRNPRYGRIQLGLRLSAGHHHRHGPEPLALLCSKMLRLFSKGRSHLGHTQHSGSPWPHSAPGMDAAATAAHRGGYLALGGIVPAAGMLARSWQAPESPRGCDVRDNLKSPSLCDLA